MTKGPYDLQQSFERRKGGIVRLIDKEDKVGTRHLSLQDDDGC